MQLNIEIIGGANIVKKTIELKDGVLDEQMIYLYLLGAIGGLGLIDYRDPEEILPKKKV